MKERRLGRPQRRPASARLLCRVDGLLAPNYQSCETLLHSSAAPRGRKASSGVSVTTCRRSLCPIARHCSTWLRSSAAGGYHHSRPARAPDAQRFLVAMASQGLMLILKPSGITRSHPLTRIRTCFDDTRDCERIRRAFRWVLAQSTVVAACSRCAGIISTCLPSAARFALSPDTVRVAAFFIIRLARVRHSPRSALPPVVLASRSGLRPRAPLLTHMPIRFRVGGGISGPLIPLQDSASTS